MRFQEAARLQVLLEGVPLPATKRELIAYAEREDEAAASELEALPDREYRSLDEVGEAIASVQPSWPQPNATLPRDESGKPPGGDSYVDPDPHSGAVRPSAPATNPPQKALEKQTKAQKEQQQRQEEELPG